MNIAYLTNQYPRVSHTFIRHEIIELESRGHRIQRTSIRRVEEKLVDPIDIEEGRKTTVVLAQPLWALLRASLAVLVTTPLRFADGMWRMLRLHRVSHRGIVVHLAYLVEACFLRSFFKANHVDHVHVHFGTNPASVAYLLKVLGGPSYSMTIHGPDELDAPVAHALKDKIAAATFTVAISSYTRAQLWRWVDPDQWQKIKVIRCTPGEIPGEITPIAPDNNHLVCVGRLSAQKGQLVLIDAIGELRDQGLDVKLTLAGDGEMRSRIEERIAARDLAECCKVTGWVDGATVRSLLADSKGMVLPSFAEGLPVAIMEAFSMGRPVISTQVAGIPELVREGRNGWLIPPGDTDSLVKAIKELLTLPIETLENMGRSGSEAVKREHCLSREIDKLESCIGSSQLS